MMKAVALHQILVSYPVNRQARIVTSQAWCRESETPLTREEIVQIQDRLRRKHRLLKHVLRIKNRSQHKYAILKKNRGLRQFRQTKEPRAFAEYVRVGLEIERLSRELSEMRKMRRFVANVEQQYKAMKGKL